MGDRKGVRRRRRLDQNRRQAATVLLPAQGNVSQPPTTPKLKFETSPTVLGHVSLEADQSWLFKENEDKDREED